MTDPERIMDDIIKDVERQKKASGQECKRAPRKKPEERLKQLKARAQRLEAALKEKRRRAETRRKIILGGWLEAICRADADRVRIFDYLGRYAASRRVAVPQIIHEEVDAAMKQAAAAKATPKP